MRTSLALCLGASAVAALALGACDKLQIPGAKPKAAAPAAPAASLALPQRKAGIWEVKMQMPDMPAMPMLANGMRRCVSAGEISGEDFRRGRRADSPCAPKVSRQLDGSIRIAGECDLPRGGHQKTDGVVKGDFSTHYETEITNTVTGTGTPMDGVHKLTMQANYLGPCPAGVEPGTMLNADNQPMTSQDMVAAFRARRQAMRAAREAAAENEPQ